MLFIFSVSDASGKIEFKDVKTNNIKKEDLGSDVSTLTLKAPPTAYFV